MGLKTAGVGHFQIPSAPAAGVSVVSGAANTLTSTAIVLSASVSAMYITGVHVETSAALAATYILVQLCVGGSGAETSIGQYLVPLSTGSTVALGYRQIYPPIPMAAGARLTVKTADSVGSKTYLVTAECILATNVVDDAIAVTTVTTLTNPVALGNVAHGGAASTLTLSTATVNGATTLTGNVAMANGLTITQATTNGHGIAVTGNGTGNGINATGGATSGDGLGATGGGSGNGIHAAAGATGKGVAITTTAGDGLSITPTGGSAIVATGNGTNMHGIVATGGTAGVSDGMKLAAGTGGVDFRANQTGSLTGNISGSVGSVTGAVGSVAGAVASVTGNVGGNVVGSVASVTADVGITQAAADKVWGSATRTLTSFGTLVADTATAVWGAVTRTLTAGTNIVLAKGTGITGFNDIAAGSAMTLTAAYDAAKTAAQAGNAMTLTVAYDAAKTAATQASVTAIPTAPLLAVSYTAPDNAGITAIKAKTDSLAFTVAGKVDANTKAINDVTVNGAGTALSPWGA